MMTGLSALMRSRTAWIELLESAGLQVKSIRGSSDVDDYEAIIEAALKEDSS